MKTHEDGVIEYDDRIAFLVEINEDGKIIDSSFYVFYDINGFGIRGIKPHYSNFATAKNYMKSVEKYSQGLDFEDVVMIIKDGGMDIYAKADSQAIFTTPPHPYKPGASIEEIGESIEWRSGVIITPNWPNYTRVKMSEGDLIFETSINGSLDSWEIVK